MDEDPKKQKLHRIGLDFDSGLEEIIRKALERAGKLNRTENIGITFKELRDTLSNSGLEGDVFENFVTEEEPVLNLDSAVDW